MYQHLQYEPRGAARELFTCREPEVLIEGPANTGKTRAVLEYIHAICTHYPGIRVLFLRQTRKALTESVLVTWEEKVLPGGEKHPCVTGRASREHRHAYTWPYAENTVAGKTYRGKSHIVLGGLDHPERLFSTEWDIICVFEAIEVSLDSYEKLFRACRNKAMPWNQIIADTNPGSEYHFLNQRAIQGKMRRLLSRHEDNPSVSEQDLEFLRALTGARRARLYEGRWVSEEGQVWEEFDPHRHVVFPHDVPKLDWHFASVDWGHSPDPGCMQVWGVKMNGREIECMYLVAEVYRLRQRMDWWADRVVELYEEFHLRAVVCDPSGKAHIDLFNDRLSSYCKRDVGRIARRADTTQGAGRSSVKAGIDLVGDLFKQGRIKFVQDCLRWGADEELRDKMRPLCTAQEVPSYVWPKQEDGKPSKDMPDPRCDDHGCDALRYAARFAWKKNLTGAEPAEDWAPGSLGYLLGTPGTLSREKSKRRSSRDRLREWARTR